MKTIIKILTLTLLFAWTAVSQYNGAPWTRRYDFDAANTNTISTALDGKLKKLNNTFGTNAEWKIVSNTVTPGNDLGAEHEGGIYFDSLLSNGTKIGIKIATKGASTNNRTVFWMYLRMSGLTFAGSDGYRIEYHEEAGAGNDYITLNRITAGNVSTELGRITRETAAGDTIKAVVSSDASPIMKVYLSSSSTTDSITVTDNVFNPTTWRFWLVGTTFNNPFYFDDLMLVSASAPPPPPTDVVAPLFADGTPITYPVTQVDKSTTGLQIKVRVTEEFATGNVDSIAIYFRDTLKLGIIAGSTKDTTVYVSIGHDFVQADVNQTYQIRSRVKDNAGNLRTGIYNFTVGDVTVIGGTSPMIHLLEMPSFGVGRIKPNQLPWGKFTHLIFFGFRPTTTPPYTVAAAGTVDSALWVTGIGPYGDGRNPYFIADGVTTNEMLYRDSAAAHNVKLILGVAAEIGTNATNFATIIADTTPGGLQDQWIRQTIGFAKRHFFKGVDINWEYPTNSVTARANINRFCRVMRESLNTFTTTPGELSWTLSPFLHGQNHATPQILASTINTYCTYVHFMMYGMNGGGVLTYNSPINEPFTSYSLENGGLPTYWNNRNIKDMIANGIQKSKIVAMLPAEAKRSTYNSGVLNPQVGITQTNEFYPAFADMRDVFSLIEANPNSVRFDTVAKVPWVAANGTYYSYEDSLSLAYKVKWARDSGLGGVSMWDLFRAVDNRSSFNVDVWWKWVNWMYVAIGNLGAVSNPIPGQVVRISPTNNSTVEKNGMTFRWNGSTGATFYQLVVTTTTGQAVTIPGSTNITDTTFTMPASNTFMQPNTSYNWYVSAHNTSGTSGIQASAMLFTTSGLSATVPQTPVLWSPISNATNISAPDTFIVHYTDSTLTRDLQIATDTAGAVNTYFLNQTGIADTAFLYQSPQFASNTNYYWRERAVNAVGSSAWSVWRRFTSATISNPVQSQVTNVRITVELPSGKIVSIPLSQYPIQVVTSLSQVTTPDSLSVTLFYLNGQLGVMERTNRAVQFLQSTSNTISGVALPLLLSNGVLSVDTTILTTQTALLTAKEQIAAGTNITVSSAVNSSGQTVWTINGTAGGSITNAAWKDTGNVSNWEIKRRHLYKFNEPTDSGKIELWDNETKSSEFLADGSSSYWSSVNNHQIGIVGANGSLYFTFADGVRMTRTQGTLTEGSGLWGMVDSVQRSSQMASDNDTVFANATVSGMYQINYYIRTSTAGSAGTVTFEADWNDGTAKSFTSGTCALNSTGNTGYVSGSVTILRASGTPTWGTTVSGAAGSPVYQVDVSITKIK